MISWTTGLDFAFRTRDLARSAMVSGISCGSDSAGKIDSGNIVVAALCGTRVAVEAKSDGGADGAVLIAPVGAFNLGFGRGFFVTTPGSASALPFDVDAAGFSVMMDAVVR